MTDLGKVVHCKRASGESDIAIVDEFHIPICPYLTNYLDEHVKQVINTKKAYAYQLLFIYRYFNSKQIDLPKRVREGEYLSNKEYENFKRHCSYRDAEWMKVDSNVSSFKIFNDKMLDKMIHSSMASDELVSSNTIKLRLSLFKSFLSYLHNLHHFTASSGSPPQYKYNLLIEALENYRKKLVNENVKVLDPFESEIPDKIYMALKECIKPDSPNNPFTKDVRQRNHLIVRLAMEAGLRRGAIAKLKLGDIKDDWGVPRITITRTPNDPADPRQDKPSQKTKMHVSPLNKNTMKDLVSYVETARTKYPQSNLHDFVFIVEKGNAGFPLSLRGFDYVFERLGKHLGFHLTPHMLRHKWNEEYDKAADALGYSGEVKEDIRKNAMGWSENSNMGRVYNAKRLAEQAQKIQQEMQREQFNKVKYND